MSEDARFTREIIAPGDDPVATTTGSRRAKLGQRVGRLIDKADVARADGVRSARDGAAIAVSTGRAQLERAQSFISFHARRRPLAVTGIAAAIGLIIGLAARTASRSR